MTKSQDDDLAGDHSIIRQVRVRLNENAAHVRASRRASSVRLFRQERYKPHHAIPDVGSALG
jgi:hypothetical protein